MPVPLVPRAKPVCRSRTDRIGPVRMPAKATRRDDEPLQRAVS
ncbi:hypothetical protein FHR33_001502 [Nonomuraea dietziae]|uniref:Uncharacterized protein n=1 Tax=Nonomuraea dietziae TaxID=65515 RepID=A0A7W5VDE4_9ACTN|nr:hypothetical protein [Nonomuraea dietziae]